MATKADISGYVVNVQGKDFITFPGLLAEAHAQGLVSIQTELVNNEPKSIVMKATVVLKEGEQVKTFTGYGDATETNVAKKVAGALLRMAETRAIARALRFACNIDMTALEELGDNDKEHSAAPTMQAKSPMSPTASKPAFSQPKQAPVSSIPANKPKLPSAKVEPLKGNSAPIAGLAAKGKAVVQLSSPIDEDDKDMAF